MAQTVAAIVGHPWLTLAVVVLAFDVLVLLLCSVGAHAERDNASKVESRRRLERLVAADLSKRREMRW